ncbi:TPA: cell envelope integrity protein TolA [Klebsiella oxytoca]|nr:cell envelope integrity protein TolA [Klebsiella oxytoca]
MKIRRPVSARIFIIPFFLTACQGTGHSGAGHDRSDRPLLPEAGELTGSHQPAAMNSEQSKFFQYGYQIQKAIREQMPGPDKYTGRTCSVRLLLSPDGLVLMATPDGGDAELCKAAMSAISRAKLPPPPDMETYQQFRNSVLDFRP